MNSLFQIQSTSEKYDIKKVNNLFYRRVSAVLRFFPLREIINNSEH